MGGEGAPWIGQAPFTTEKHVFQNLGDGTYQHSGLLAIRAAAIAGVNITYKILYNDAVAMTGGQPVDGRPNVAEITRQVAAEGAKKIVVVTDDPDKYPGDAGFAAGVEIHDRAELDRVQRELREIPGLTVLVYDQTCAAEKRRRRKRGIESDPPKRVVINEAVCEGCGDCSVKSNCISVRPLETEFGRKRTIDQSNCNKDYSCIEGFCPSFVTVHGGRPRRIERAAVEAQGDPFADLPLPSTPALASSYGILITGIGGTGVLTVGALVGMAAHLEGKGCTVLDFTGLAQKNGAVMSHVRLAPAQEALHAVRIAVGGADLLLACDMVVAAGPAALTRVAQGKDARDRQSRPAADFGVRHRWRHGFRCTEDGAGHRDGRRYARRRIRRRHANRHRADGRLDRDQPVHAGLCVPEGTRSPRRRRAGARDRAQRRCRRRGEAHICVGTARRARPCPHRQARAADGSPCAVAKGYRRVGHPSCRVSRPLSG